MAEAGEKKHKKTELRVSGGIVGLIALSGAIAAATLVSILNNRGKRRPNDNLPNKPPTKTAEEVKPAKREEDGEGLRSLLRTPQPYEETIQREKDVSRICLTPIGSRWHVTEKESDLGLNRKDEKRTFDDCGTVLNSLKESVPEYDDPAVSEPGISVALEDATALENGSSNVIDNKKDPSNLQLAHAMAVTEESFENSKDAMVPTMEEPKTKEENSVHDEEDDEDEKFEKEVEEDDVDEKFEEEVEEDEEEEEFSYEKEAEGSDGTGDSSIDSTTEAVWPSESFEEQEMKICRDITSEAVKEEAEMGLEREFSVKTRKDHEEIDNFESTNTIKLNMEKEEAVSALNFLMEKAASKSSISRLLLLFVIVGLALLLLNSTMLDYLQESSPKFV